MDLLTSLLPVIHLIGLALGVGCATAKITLLFRSGENPASIQAFITVVRPITRLIILGIILLVISGIGWIILGYPFTTILAVKVALVAAILIIGPVIDNIVEPKFLKLAPMSGEAVSAEYVRIYRQYVLLEVVATGLFYAIIVMWLLA